MLRSTGVLSSGPEMPRRSTSTKVRMECRHRRRGKRYIRVGFAKPNSACRNWTNQFPCRSLWPRRNQLLNIPWICVGILTFCVYSICVPVIFRFVSIRKFSLIGKVIVQQSATAPSAFGHSFQSHDQPAPKTGRSRASVLK